MKEFEVVVLGGGPAGYVAAIRAAQLGFKVACIEAAPNLGGTCLNVGCIPSKALLESSTLYEKAQHEFAAHGIQAQGLSMDVGAMLKRKDEIVKQLTGGIAQLFKANGVEWISGRGRVEANKTVAVDGGERFQASKALIIAVGSQPIDLPMAKMDGQHIVSSTEALAFAEVPRRLGVIGAGVIGLELGSVWKALGAEVTILEASPQLLPIADKQLAQEAGRQFKKQGLDIRLGAKVSGAKIENNQVLVSYESASGSEEIQVDKLLVAVGRKPNTADLLADGVAIKLDARGFIEVDAHCQTAEAGVYAIGDCVRGAMLAHKASEEGVMVAEIIAGQAGHVRYDLIPSVIYTHPEMAWVGATEEALQAEGRAYKKGDFPFAANGRAKAAQATGGFIKILADAESDEILGAHLIGAQASEMIHEIMVAMEFYAASEDLARIMHAHPSLSEALHEAALAVDGRALHKINKKSA